MVGGWQIYKNVWLDGYNKMFEKIDGWLDGQAKKSMVGGIEQQMAGWIAKMDSWLDGHEKNRKMVGWI